ncbi:MAG: zinc ribbon domain-containing protein [Methylocella sp.]
MGDVSVYKYGLLAPIGWDDECEDELRKMTRLWNSLVEIERDCAAKYRAIRSGHAELAEAEATLASINAGIEAAVSETKKRRATARSKKIDTSDIETQVKKAREKRKIIAARVKELRAIAREAMRAQLAAVEDDRKERVKSARQNSGLYWGNYNAVIASYDIARSKALKDGSELRFRRHDGSGRLVAQIIGGLSLDELFSCQHSQLRIPGKDSRKTTIDMVVYSRDRTPVRVRWPMIMHRPLPDGGVVKEATITRRRTNSRWRNKEWEWSVSLLCRIPDTDQKDHERPGAVCAVDVGWRRIHDGLRVAVIASRADDATAPRFESIMLPARLLEIEDYTRDIQSQIDQCVNEAIARLRSMSLAAMPVGDDPDAPLARAARAARISPKPTQRMLATLAHWWRREAATWQIEQLAALEKIVARNRRDWGEKSALVTKARRARLDLYRQAAAKLARAHRVIAIEAVDWRQAYMDRDEKLSASAKRYRGLAAVGELLSAIKMAAAKYGSAIHEHEGRSTWICHVCGSAFAPGDPGALIQTCPHCGSTWDQDKNAALNILAEIPSSAPAHEGNGTPFADEKHKEEQIAETRWHRAKRLKAKKEMESRQLSQS